MKILYIASTPTDAANLRLEREITEIQRAIAASGARIELVTMPNISFEDFDATVFKVAPDILHISAHGEGEALALGDANERRVNLTADALKVFLDTESPPRLVYLNSCNSASIASQIIDVVPMAIGTTAPITNHVARMAAVSFYSRILSGRSVSKAFLAGRTVMSALAKNQVSSVLYHGPGVNTDKEYLHYPPRLVARLAEKPRAKSNHCEFVVGLLGCSANTHQVIFFTDDETFMFDEEDLESSLSSIVRTQAVNGEVWLSEVWSAQGNFRIFSCATTLEGEVYSVASTLCEALDRYYEAAGEFEEVPKDLEDLLRTLRGRRHGKITRGARPWKSLSVLHRRLRYRRGFGSNGVQTHRDDRTRGHGGGGRRRRRRVEMIGAPEG